MNWLNRPASDTQITHRDRLWLYVVAAIIMLLLVIPTFIVIPMSFSDSQYLEFPPEVWSLRWYSVYFESSKWMRATVTSLQVGTLTMLVATPLGTMAAYALFVSGHRAARTIFMLLITPMIVPVILIAIGVFYAYGRVGLNNTIAGIVLAHTVLAAPLVMIVITSALRNYDLNQERVARSLGATRIRAFFVITLPQIKFSIVTAALLAFSDLVRRSHHFHLRFRRLERDADQAHVRRLAGFHRPDHRRHLHHHDPGVDHAAARDPVYRQARQVLIAQEGARLRFSEAWVPPLVTCAGKRGKSVSGCSRPGHNIVVLGK